MKIQLHPAWTKESQTSNKILRTKIINKLQVVKMKTVLWMSQWTMGSCRGCSQMTPLVRQILMWILIWWIRWIRMCRWTRSSSSMHSRWWCSNSISKCNKCWWLSNINNLEISRSIISSSCHQVRTYLPISWVATLRTHRCLSTLDRIRSVSSR